MKDILKQAEEKMKKSIVSYEENLASIRAGQANPAVLSRITFDYWGAATELTSMSDIRVADSRTLVITPYDASTLKAIEKALLASDLGITPANDGKVIRLVFPQLTEERRKELAKQVKKMGENAKVAIRNLRRAANEDAKKQKNDGNMTEDELKDSEKLIQDLTDKYVKNVDTLGAAKEKEIMTV